MEMVKEGKYSFPREHVAKRAAGTLVCVKGGEESAEIVCVACCGKVACAEAMVFAAENAVKKMAKVAVPATMPVAEIAAEATAEAVESEYSAEIEKAADQLVKAIFPAEKAAVEVVEAVVTAETPIPAEKAKKDKPRVDAKLTAHSATISAMLSRENQTVCPIEANGKHCGQPKTAEHLVCEACNKAYYWIGHKVIKMGLERAANRIDPTVFGQVVETAKAVIMAADQELDEKDLVVYLRASPTERPGVDFPDFSGLPYGGIQNAVRAAQKAAEDEKKRASNGDRWDFAISCIKEKCPVGQPQPKDFVGLRHASSGPISEAMIRRACEIIWGERWETWSKEAMETVGKAAVRAQFPDGYIDVGYFSEGVIEDLGLKFEGKFLTEKMMKRCAHEVIDERKLNKVHAVAQKAFGGGGGHQGRANEPADAKTTQKYGQRGGISTNIGDKIREKLAR